MAPADRMRGWFAALLALVLLLPAGARAAVPETAPPPAPPPAATTTAIPRIGVMTMEPGEVFFERFGHNAIVVAAAGAEPIAYNFGYFDMREEGFVGKFVAGQMRYMLVALPLDEDLAHYRE